MKSTITITPVTNIAEGRVTDESKIERRTYSSHEDFFSFFNERSGQTRRDNLINVSLFDDLLVEDDVRYKILNMLSK